MSERQRGHARTVSSVEPNIDLVIVRMDNSDDVPGLGKVYHVYAESRGVRVLAYMNRFRSYDTAVKWATDVFPNLRESVVLALDYAARTADDEARPKTAS